MKNLVKGSFLVKNPEEIFAINSLKGRIISLKKKNETKEETSFRNLRILKRNF